MVIARQVNRWTCIVPVRFRRAPHATDPEIESANPDPHAPEPDDRGFMPVADGCAVLCVGYNSSESMEARHETRVRLIREAIDPAAQLFLTCSDANIIEYTSPADGTAAPAQEKAIIKFKAKAAGECFLEVRWQDRNGPILHRLKVVVNRIRWVQIRAHVPTINGAAQNDASGAAVPAQSVRTDDQIRRMIAEANRIYYPYGVQFRINGAIDRAGPALNMVNRGFVNDQTAEFGTMTAHHRAAAMINMYFVPQIGSAAEVGQVGGSANSARSDPAGFGSLIADMTTRGQTIAHELGHVLNLVNDPNPNPFVHVNTVNDPAIPGTGRDVRDDVVSRRRLMWAYTNFAAAAGMAYRNNVGYGADRPGGMLAYKNYAADRTDQEVQEVRRRAARI